MQEYYSPNDPAFVRETDSASIQAAVDAAAENGLGIVRIPRMNVRTGKPIWNIDSAILLPSDMTVYLDDCHLRLADGAICNVFRNSNMYTPEGLTLSGTQHDIRIIGSGRAVLDGGIHNGLTQGTAAEMGYSDPYLNNFILFHNVTDFELSGFRMVDQRYWCVNLLFCRGGHIRDLDIRAKDNVINQDGIDLRLGCSNITIENITGAAGDDMIALSGFVGASSRYAVAGADIDIHSVIIHNIRATSRSWGIVSLRNQDGVRIYNIHIDGIMDSAPDDPHVGTYAAVRIGQNYYVHSRASQPGETRDITVQNVWTNRNAAVLLGATLINAQIRNIHTCGTAVCAVSSNGGAYLKNVLIEGVYHSSVDEHPSPRFTDRCGPKFALFNFEHNGVGVPEGHGHRPDLPLGDLDRVEDLTIRDVYLGDNHADKVLVYASGKTDIAVENVHSPAEPIVVTENGAKVTVR